MSPDKSAHASGIQFEPPDKLPVAVAFGLGLQLTALSISATVLITTIVMRAAGQSEAYLAWAVFAAVAIGGVSSMLQAARMGRLGMGHVLMMGSSGAFIAVCIEALKMGGTGTLAVLVVAAALFQFVIAERLSLFRQILTPTVSGTVLMLIPISVMSAIFNMLGDVPDDSPSHAAPLIAVVTVAIICGLILKTTGALRLWAPVIGIGAGAIAAAFFGVYDTARVAEASWVGIPAAKWPGLNLSFGSTFWTLVPGFMLAAMIGSIRTISSAVAVQRISWRRPRAIDFRAVQGAVSTDGLSNLLSGLLGTIPNTAYSTGASLAQLTGVAARAVGFAAGAIFLALAFLPKALDLLLAIPGPVLGAYLVVMMAMLFMIGVQMVMRDGLDYRKCLIVGVSFWIGLGFQSGMIFPEFVTGFAGGLLNNGMTAGGLVAILLTLFVKMTEPRARRLQMDLNLSNLPKFQAFLADFNKRSSGGEAMAKRLDVIGEEVLATLCQDGARDRRSLRRRLFAKARKDGRSVVLEIIAGRGEGKNLQDQLAALSESIDEDQLERELSLRILRHLAASVRHQQYHETDIVTVRIDPPKAFSSTLI